MIRKRKFMLAARLLTLVMAGSCAFFGGSMITMGAGVKFKDYNFKQEVYNSLKKPLSENLTDADTDYPFSLYLNNNEVWSLEGIQNFHNADYVDIFCSNIADLTPLSSLTKLRYLDINSSCVTDLTPLTNMKSIKSFHCSNLNLDDYSAIGSLENLEYLTLSNCNIKDLSFLQNLKNLKELTLDSNYIDDISILRNFNHLTTLYLYNNEITDISPLENLSPDTDGNSSYKSVNISNNMVDTADSNTKRIIDTLKSRGFDVDCDNKKDDLHVLSINGERYNLISTIDKNDDLNIVFNKNIENLKDNLEAVLNDNKYDGSADINNINLNYAIEGSVLKIAMKNAFVNSDLNNLSLRRKGDDYTFETLGLSEDKVRKCDVNGNGDVDLADLTQVSRAYNKNSKTAAEWNIREDVNRDGIIDIYDLAKISAQLR